MSKRVGLRHIQIMGKPVAPPPLKPTHLFPGTNTEPTRIIKIKVSSTMEKVTHLDLDGIGLQYDIIYATPNLYSANYSVYPDYPAGIIASIDPLTMTQSQFNLQLEYNEFPACRIIHVPTLDKLFVGCDIGPARVVKCTPVPLSRDAGLTLPTGENCAWGLAYVSPYLYVGLAISPGRIVRVNPDTMTRVDHLDLATGENVIRRLIYIPPYLYAGCDTAPGRIVKIDPSTFTRVSALTLDTGEDYVYDMVYVEPYLYVNGYTSPGRIIKVDPTTMTRISALTLDSGEDLPSLCYMEPYLYGACFTWPSIIVQIDPETMTKIDALTLETGDDWAWGITPAPG